MTQALTYRIDRRLPVAVVCLNGEITPLSSQVARTALLDALAAEPTSVIIDLSGVTAVDDVALTVFPAMAETAAQWPGAPVLLSGPEPQVAEALRRMAVTSQLDVHPTLRAAVDVAVKEPVPQRVHARLEPTVDAPRIARDLAEDACWEWGVPEAATPVKIVSSELVTNAVRHAGTVVDLTVSLRDHGNGHGVRVSVRDGTPELARMQTPTESDDHGRGLLIVDSLATAWGNVPLAKGKTVWAMVVPRRPAAYAPPEAKVDHDQEV